MAKLEIDLGTVNLAEVPEQHRQEARQDLLFDKMRSELASQYLGARRVPTTIHRRED